MSVEHPGSVSRRSGEVSGAGMRILEVLEQHTKFPWPLLKALCQQKAVEPSGLTTEQARAMIDDIVKSLAGLTSHGTAESARLELIAALKDDD